MNINLAAAEAKTLIRALELYLIDLRTELADSDSPDAHATLKAEQERLSAVLVRLREAVSSDGLQPLM